MDAQDIGLWAGAIAAGGTALIAFVRRASSARTELAKDETERDVLQLLLRERDDARSELEQSQAALRHGAASLARAEAEKESLRREVEKLAEEFGAFQRKMARLYPETAGFMDSDVMPWTEVKS